MATLTSLEKVPFSIAYLNMSKQILSHPKILHQIQGVSHQVQEICLFASGVLYL